MPSGGQIGSGVKIGFATTSPTVWTVVPEVREVTVPQFERDRVETTVHGTTSLRTYIPGLADVSDLEFTMLANLDAGSVCMQLQAYERSQTTLWFRVEIPVDPDLTTSTYFAMQFQGRVSRWAPDTPIDDAKTVGITVQFNANFMTQQEMASAL
jgi:hypothetical protein